MLVSSKVGFPLASSVGAALVFLITFGLGAAAFMWVTKVERARTEFSQAPVAQPTSIEPPIAPLPGPMIRHASTPSAPTSEVPIDTASPSLPEPLDEASAFEAEPSAQRSVPEPFSEGETFIDSTVVAAEEHYMDSDPIPLAEWSPLPEYPARALRRGDSGTVRVRVAVDTRGHVTDASLVQRSSSRQLDRAALNAVKEWRFKPALHEGQAVPGVVVIPIDFNLDSAQ